MFKSGKGWQYLSFIGDVGPFAGLAAGLGLLWLLRLLYIDATISPMGAGLVYVTSTARILYAMSQIGYVPKFLSYLNKEEFPVAAIYNKGGAGCASSKFPVGRGGAPMPYCMFFHGGYALHGSYEVPGYHASHGCIRLFVDDAAWLNEEFSYDSRVRVFVVND